LDPVLKAADELFGKLRSLANRDFADLWRVKRDRSPTFRESIKFVNVLYLFALFWARVEILRRVGVYVNLSKDARGKQLSQFLHCLESTRVRVVERAFQRALGEFVLVDKGGRPECMPFIEFAEAYLGDEASRFRKWFTPLESLLRQTLHTRHRQRVLLYGAVLHSMLNTLDPGHATTKRRPGYANKLTNKTRRQLKHRVFGCYLPFVANADQYVSPRRRKRVSAQE